MSSVGGTGQDPVESTRVAQSGELPLGTGAEPEVGARIDRYLVLTVLGAGAMGVVFQVYDPELDRQVALKLLKNYGGDQELARTRLRREAQALAKLNHENVVTVYDVGLHAGQVYVTMEFVAGQTLSAWLQQQERDWRAIVEVFIAAGRGLAAAHREGLIHRDFKPDNVMIGDEGRVRVMDFGLARRDSESEQSTTRENPVERARDIEASVSGTLDLKLTQTGSSMGTPAYMAGEQFEGRDVTARSDQFGFCVALYEALYRRRPFAGSEYRDLARAVLKGELIPPPSRTEVPKWLAPVVTQGLARDPGARHPSMDVLLTKLGAGEARRRRRLLGVGAGVLALCVATGLGYRQLEHAQRVAACAAEGERITEVWNAETTEQLHAALEASGQSYAGATAERVAARLDAQAEQWRETATLACTHETVERSWDAETGAKARWCLADRRSELAAMVEAFTNSEGEGLVQAIKAASSFSVLAHCVDPSVLVQMNPPPPADRWPALGEQRSQLQRAAYLSMLAKQDEALELANAAAREAEALDWPPLRARAKLQQALVLEQQAAYDNASAIGREAYSEGVRAEAWDVAADAAILLAQVEGVRGAKPELAELWVAQAELAAYHHGAPSSVRESKRLSVLAAQHYTRGEYEQAKQLFEQILVVLETELGERHPGVAKTINNLGVLSYSLQDYEQAETYYRRAVDLSLEVHGPEHPETATSLLNLANLFVSEGEPEDAKALYERALAIQEASKGSEHPDLALTLSNLGHCHEQLEQLPESLEFYQRSLGIRERAYGQEHPEVAWSLSGVAAIYSEMGRCAEAVPLLERSLKIREDALPPTHMLIGETMTSLGSCLVELGESERGLELLERALPIARGEGALPMVRALAEHALAQALWGEAGDDASKRARALELGRAARASYAAVGKAGEDEVAELDGWLAERE